MQMEGIAINQVPLIFVNVLFTVFALVLMVALIAFAYISHDPDVKKAKIRLRQLQAKPNAGPSSHRKIAKLRNRLAKEKRERRQDRWIYAICLSVIAVLLAFCVIPGWTDYVRKDYVVYEGSFTVDRAGKQSHLILEDGTQLLGGLGLQNGTYEGKIVYAKRMKITLGGQGDDSMIFEDWRRKYEGNLWNDA